MPSDLSAMLIMTNRTGTGVPSSGAPTSCLVPALQRGNAYETISVSLLFVSSCIEVWVPTQEHGNQKT